MKRLPFGGRCEEKRLQRNGRTFIRKKRSNCFDELEAIEKQMKTNIRDSSVERQFFRVVLLR
jgi:hypothetical protein